MLRVMAVAAVLAACGADGSGLHPDAELESVFEAEAVFNGRACVFTVDGLDWHEDPDDPGRPVVLSIPDRLGSSSMCGVGPVRDGFQSCASTWMGRDGVAVVVEPYSWDVEPWAVWRNCL